MAFIKVVSTQANIVIKSCNTYILNKISRLFWKLVSRQLRMFISDKVLKTHFWNFTGYLSNYAIYPLQYSSEMHKFITVTHKVISTFKTSKLIWP